MSTAKQVEALNLLKVFTMTNMVLNLVTTGLIDKALETKEPADEINAFYAHHATIPMLNALWSDLALTILIRDTPAPDSGSKEWGTAAEVFEAMLANETHNKLYDSGPRLAIRATIDHLAAQQNSGKES